MAAFSGTTETAPGYDNIGFKDWKDFDPKLEFMTALFNNIIRHKVQPEQWNKFRTKLILKPEKEERVRSCQTGDRSLC